MKKLYYMIFKPHVYRCAYNIRLIRNDKRERMLDAIRYLNKWDDMPLSDLAPIVAGKLGIRYDRVAHEFITELCFPQRDLNELEKLLPYNPKLPFKK